MRFYARVSPNFSPTHLKAKHPLFRFVLCAVSPAVVVPSLLYLQDMGYGVEGGIPTFLIAGASLNDVIGITGFNVIFGMKFFEGNLAKKIMHGPLELILGVFGGVFLGALLWYLPSRDTVNY